ncbi:hypothetical protein [Kingella negevensis]|nr:hypothetical protein [Kingella negevensis]MDK4689283.1 hypothetical protein [Kingella negevensis]WII91364.1 hypothetical protein QEO93_01890 [Kingella negevensis]WII92685.1 hypothetical protein QEO94_08590 [Kingella negevensis]
MQLKRLAMLCGLMCSSYAVWAKPVEVTIGAERYHTAKRVSCNKWVI